MYDTADLLPSERQYKRKIKKWDFKKNSKAVENRSALLALESSATNLDIASVYEVKGEGIAAHKLLRYARSCGLGTQNIGES